MPNWHHLFLHFIIFTLFFQDLRWTIEQTCQNMFYSFQMIFFSIKYKKGFENLSVTVIIKDVCF